MEPPEKGKRILMTDPGSVKRDVDLITHTCKLARGNPLQPKGMPNFGTRYDVFRLPNAPDAQIRC